MHTQLSSVVYQRSREHHHRSRNLCDTATSPATPASTQSSTPCPYRNLQSWLFVSLATTGSNIYKTKLMATYPSTCAISVIRVKYLQQGGDYSYENIEGSAWSVAEVCSGVICACLPTLRPLVSKWIPSLSNRLHKTTRRQSCWREGNIKRVSQHTRGNSDTSNMMDIRDKEDFYCIGLESNEDIERRRTRDSLLSRGANSPTPPAVAHIAPHTSRRPTAYYNWMKSTVTTEIGTGKNSMRSDSNRDLSTTAIQVQRDVVMHKI